MRPVGTLTGRDVRRPLPFTGPLVPPGRVVGLDVARCLALVGMIATHVLATVGEDGGVTWPHQVAGGRASALFAVLAGVSLALMSGRQVPVRGRARVAVSAGLATRALLIALVGLALGGLETNIAVILTYYGVLFLLGLPFLGLRAGPLFALSAAWLVAVPVLSHLLRPALPMRGVDSPSFASLAHPAQLLSELTFTGYYPAVVWVAYLLAGMAVGRLDLRRWSTAVGLAGAGAVLAAASVLASALLVDRPAASDALRRTFGPDVPTEAVRAVLQEGLYGTTPTDSWWWLAVRAPHSGTPFDLAHTIGSALLVIGLCLALGRAVPRTASVVFGAGAMTLSLYTLHVVLRTPELLPEEGGRTYAQHLAVVLLLGALYRLARRSGPLERLVALAAGAATRLTRRFVCDPAGSPREGIADESGRIGG